MGSSLPPELWGVVLGNLTVEDVYGRCAFVSRRLKTACDSPRLLQAEWLILHAERHRTFASRETIPNMLRYLRENRSILRAPRCKLKITDHGGTSTCTNAELKEFKLLKLTGVTTLDLSFELDSLLRASARTIPSVLPRAFASVMPNLRELCLDNVTSDLSSSLTAVVKKCPLEILRFNNARGAWFNVLGSILRDSTTLRDLSLDNITFYNGRCLTENANIFLLMFCSRALERLSIRGARLEISSGFHLLVEGTSYEPAEGHVDKLCAAAPRLARVSLTAEPDRLAQLRQDFPKIKFITDDDQEADPAS